MRLLLFFLERMDLLITPVPLCICSIEACSVENRLFFALRA